MQNNRTEEERTEAETVAESYYDSSDADKFYETVWGGEDIHVGLYEPGMSTPEASQRTVETMADYLKTAGPDRKVIDLGAGYGGSGRYLSKRFDCPVTCLNISEVQNERNRMLNREQGLDDKLTVLHGSFESIPCEDAEFDIVWSQDSFLHSDRREVILDEINRVLKPGGELIFTDPMQADDCPEGVLQPVYDRLNLESLASIKFYREELAARGFNEVQVTEMTHQLRNHYATVRQNLLDRYDELRKNISADYMDKMIKGLEHWVNAADNGYLAWGILHFSKPAS